MRSAGEQSMVGKIPGASLPHAAGGIGGLRAGEGASSAARRRGAVLLMMLVLIVVLSAVLVQFTEKGMTEIIAEGHYVERNRLRLTAYSALETTLAVMADVIAIDGGLTAPSQGWSDPLAVAGFDPGKSVRTQVSFSDESGKLPLENLDEATLYLLFTEMGIPVEDSLKLTHSLLDWTDEDDNPRIDGAESETYAVAEWPYESSNRPLRQFEELAVVDGFSTLFFDDEGRPNQWYEAFSNAVSVYPTGSINVNSASDLALRAFAGFGDPLVVALRDYLAGADGIRGTADDRYFANPGELAGILGELPTATSLSTFAEVIRIQVDVWEGGTHFGLDAVVQSSQAGTSGGARGARRANPGTARSTSSTASSTNVPYPFVFLELREDVGQNRSLAAPALSDGESAEEVSPPRANSRR